MKKWEQPYLRCGRSWVPCIDWYKFQSDFFLFNRWRKITDSCTISSHIWSSPLMGTSYYRTRQSKLAVRVTPNFTLWKVIARSDREGRPRETWDYEQLKVIAEGIFLFNKQCDEHILLDSRRLFHMLKLSNPDKVDKKGSTSKVSSPFNCKWVKTGRNLNRFVSGRIYSFGHAKAVAYFWALLNIRMNGAPADMYIWERGWHSNSDDFNCYRP